jgi:ribonuclease HI
MAIAGRVKLFFDGGWRPATGMETAVVVRGREYIRRNLGPGSSLEAEWLALIEAVRLANELGLTDPVFLGDSLAVIAQANATTAPQGPCARHFHTLATLRSSTGPLRLRHIKRSQNLAGIALARLHVR